MPAFESHSATRGYPPGCTHRIVGDIIVFGHPFLEQEDALCRFGMNLPTESVFTLRRIICDFNSAVLLYKP